MKASELLIPRFEVIATFPNMEATNIKSVGDILTDDGYNAVKDQDNRAIFAIKFDEYPHLFRKMNWWENRKEEEMPSKLVSLSNKDSDGFDISKQDIYHIKKWDMKIFFGYIDVERRSGCDLNSWKPEYGYIPVD